MPGVYRYPLSQALEAIEKAVSLGIKAIALFPEVSPHKKDAEGSYALDQNNITCQAIKKIRKRFPSLIIICDVALDPYTDHGHDGILIDGKIDNDATLEILTKQALIQAEAGCDTLAPSDMMDGRIFTIREALEEHGFTNTRIFSYAAKYASSFYGPFRDAIHSATLQGESSKETYQMDTGNKQEAIREIALDLQEGADAIIIKPGLPYLDIISNTKAIFQAPVIAYQVSGEYAMITFAAQNKALDYKKAILESLLCFKRAGANAIMTYFALEVAEYLQNNKSI